MAYNVSQEYNEVIYSGDAQNRLKLLFNNVEYTTANSKTESIKKTSKILADGGARFSLDNFKAQEVEIVMHDIDLEDIVEPVSISIGTLVDDEYEYVPIGIYNLSEVPTTNSGKTTIKLIDNAIKFDFPYNAQEVIEANGGEATMMQILQDICTKANVTLATNDFINMNTKVSVWDNSINARQYVMYIAEKAGCIATIDRNGELIFVDLNSQTPIQLNPLLFEKYTVGDKLKISRVVYEDAIRKFEYGNESYGTLYINSANPYITSTNEVENIYDSIKQFEIYSMNISKILGNPALDPWDILEFTYKGNTYQFLGQNELTYRGTMIQKFDTQIGSNEKSKENVTINSEESRFRKIGTDINQLEGTITMIAGEVGQYDERITTVEQTVDRIEQSAISYEDLKRNVKASNLLHIENAYSNYPLRFSIKNASLVYPSNYLYPSDNLYPIDALHLVVDKTRDLSEDAKFIELPIKKLYSKDNVYDEFVVENKRAYIIHRIGVNQDESTYILENEVTEELGTVEIELFEDNNYLYLYEFQNNEGVIYEIDYTIPSAFTDAFATEVYVDSSITQTANQIMLQVDEKVDEEEIIAKLNVAVEDGQGIINLVGNTVTIDSDNFKLDVDGKIEATAGDIGGFEIDGTTFSAPLTTLIRMWNGEEYVDTELEIFTSEDIEKVRNYIAGTGTLTPEELIRYDVNNDGVVDISDMALMIVTTYYNINTDNPGRFLLNTTSATNVITFYDKDENERVNLGLYNFIMQSADGSKQTQINFNGVNSPAFNNNSLESLKKNIKRYDNAIDIIKKSDIYSYNWKNEKDTDKKHYGLIIGDKYNTPKEFISNDGKGIDTYAMVSICLQAIKEQQEEIELLKKEIKLLKEEK